MDISMAVNDEENNKHIYMALIDQLKNIYIYTGAWLH